MTDEPTKSAKSACKRVFLPNTLWKWVRMRAAAEDTTIQRIVHRALVELREKLDGPGEESNINP